MENWPGVLFYKTADYAGLEIIPIIELFSASIRKKLEGNLSGF